MESRDSSWWGERGVEVTSAVTLDPGWEQGVDGHRSKVGLLPRSRPVMLRSVESSKVRTRNEVGTRNQSYRVCRQDSRGCEGDWWLSCF